MMTPESLGRPFDLKILRRGAPLRDVCHTKFWSYSNRLKTDYVKIVCLQIIKKTPTPSAERSCADAGGLEASGEGRKPDKLSAENVCRQHQVLFATRHFHNHFENPFWIFYIEVTSIN
jgi:hypothetical protein